MGNGTFSGQSLTKEGGAGIKKEMQTKQFAASTNTGTPSDASNLGVTNSFIITPDLNENVPRAHCSVQADLQSPYLIRHWARLIYLDPGIKQGIEALTKRDEGITQSFTSMLWALINRSKSFI